MKISNIPVLLFHILVMLHHLVWPLFSGPIAHCRGMRHQCKNSPMPESDEIQISHHLAPQTNVDLIFAHRLLAGPAVWGAVGYEALSVTSCSILFLCCCALAVRPPGPTLHCSSNNCCGTLNICKAPLLLTQPPLHWAACVCISSTACEVVCGILWCWSYLVRVMSACAQTDTATRTFNMMQDCESKQISKVVCQLQWERDYCMCVHVFPTKLLHVHIHAICLLTDTTVSSSIALTFVQSNQGRPIQTENDWIVATLRSQSCDSTVLTFSFLLCRVRGKTVKTFVVNSAEKMFY